MQLTTRSIEVSRRAKYEALSYTWGAATEGFSVVVNGTYRIPVTDNLYRALRRLRGSRKHRTMWIDAICINQLDHQERSSQVEMMGDIYHNASCVIIWLGEPDPQVSMSRVSIKHTFKTFQRLQRKSQIFSQLAVIPRLAKGQHQALDSAIRQTTPPWHERAWTMQEYFLAQRVCVVFGGHKWTRQEFDQVCNVVTKAYGLWRQPCPDLFKLQSRMSLRGLFREMDEDRGPDFIKKTMLLRNVCATDQRDLIYSILGLITTREATLIGVDYSLTFSEVCSKATFASMRARNDHAILRAAHSFDNPERSEFPSWTVDFSDNDALAQLEGGRHPRLGLFRLSESVSFPPTELDNDNRHLKLQGVMCGRIKEVRRLDQNWNSENLFDFIRAAAEGGFADASASESHLMLNRAVQFAGSRIPLGGLGSGFTMYLCIGIEPFDQKSTINDQLINQLWFYWDAIALALANRTPQKLEGVKQSFVERNGSLIIQASEDVYIVSDETSMFVLDNGLIGLGRHAIAIGDEVVVCPGGDRLTSPFLILRADSKGLTFRGLAYVHGCMDEKYWKDWHDLDSFGQSFVLS